MAKRKNENRNGKGGKKKFKLSSGIVEPGQYGIYATCPKFKERACMKELSLLFGDKIEEYYTEELEKGSDDDEEEEEELSIEEALKKEIAELKDTSKEAKKLKKIVEVDLGCECLIFMKCRKPIVPSSFVQRICQEALDAKLKSTRFTQRLAPIDLSCTASIEEVKKMASKILKPYFHKEENQEPLKFAIQINKRNFNQLDKMDIIKTIAGCVGNDHGHKVDLKNYDKLILVECFKSNVGMSVIDKFDELYKFNLQQIFEKSYEENKETPN